MAIKQLNHNVLLSTKRDVLRLHLYFKLLQYGIRPFENDIDIILELYLFGGYSNREEQARFIARCLEKKLKKTEQSIRNTLSKYTTNGVFQKVKNTQLFVNEQFIPKVQAEKLVLSHNVSHAE